MQCHLILVSRNAVGRLKFKRALVALRMFGVHATNVSPVGHCCMDIVVAVRFNMMRIQSAHRMIERDTEWKPWSVDRCLFFFFLKIAM